jgi:ADP-heptose:LPS heptosyltransferase
VIEYDGHSLFFNLIKQFRRSKADAVILLSPKARYAIASFVARIQIRIGKGYRWYSFFTNRNVFEHRKTAERNEAAYNLRMLSELGIRADENLLPNIDKSLLPENPTTENNYIVFHITTGGSAPIWDKNRWVEFAAQLKQQYQFPVILTGTEAESEYLFIVAERMKHLGVDVHIQCGNDLLVLARVLEDAMLVITGSTGPGHISAALGTPTIGLFVLATSLSKERWGLRGLRTINLSPTQAPRTECPSCSNCECIAAITNEQVLQAAHKLLD